jgi:alpha-L-rhamnosidase
MAIVRISGMNTASPFSQASWIASSIVGGPRTSAPAPYMRKTFRLDQPVKSAQLAITALGIYECEINGSRVGDEIFAPGWTEYRKRVQYQVYDVAGHLRSGENVLGAILGDGWYCGFLGWQPRQTYGDRPRLLTQLEIVLENGSTFTIVSDGSWRTSPGPILESDLLMGESYDARLELGNWSQPCYDDSRWLNALLSVPPSIPELSPRLGPPVRRMGEIKPLKESRRMLWDAQFRIFDLGQNFAGRARISVRAAAGTTLKLQFAEVPNPDGSAYLENLRTARCTEYYTCKSEETETYEPTFTFHGFRYVEASGLKPEDFLEVTGVVLHSDTPPTGTFRCSHEKLNQLQHNIVWGQKSNFLEVPTDCPQRDERLGWTGDAQVFVRTAAFNMDVQAFFHKWIRDFRDSQRAHGGVPCVIPATWDFGPGEDGGPAWADAAIICPWTIYLCYADRSILEEHYESMRRFMGFIAEHRCKGYIRNHPDLTIWNGFGDWLALDGGGKTEGMTPHDLIGAAFYAYDAEIMAKTADILGRHDDAKDYRYLHGEIVEAFRRRYVTPEGLVFPGTQTAYVLALHFGLLDEAARATAGRELARHVEQKGFHLATGFVGTPYILEVLEKTGHLDVAYKLLEQETFPSWLFPVNNGATTIWERWDGWTPEKGFQDKGMNSFNHYAYGAVGAWMVQSVAGLELDPNEPGYKHVIFRPRPGGTITWAKASLQTIFGLAAIHWELKGPELHINLTVPASSRATLSLPEGYTTQVASAYGPGLHSVVVHK